MSFINKIKKNILSNSIKTNLLGLYLAIMVVMILLLTAMIFYSIDLNHSYNKIMLNFENYNKIYYQVNTIDKDVYMNITEQEKFSDESYDQRINQIKEELKQIGKNLEGDHNIELLASVEVLDRTVDSLEIYIDKAGLSVEKNYDFAKREELLASISHIKDIIKDNIQSLMELNLTQSQKHIKAIKTSYNFALALIIILVIISILASIKFLFFIIKDTVNKINVVLDNANRLANGDLSIENIHLGESQESQILALSFNKMKNNIKDYITQLSSSEMRISSILNTLNDCIVTTSSKGEIESCNIAMEKIFGYEKNEIIGQNINKFISAVDFSAYKDELFNAQKLIKDSKIIDNKYQLEGLKKDGTKIPVEISYNEVEFEGQKVTTFVIHDITEHQNVEKMKNEFVSTVSHELRTPLTSIKGALGLIASGVVGNLPEKAENLINIANNNCIRLTNLINDILDLEKIKAGKYTFVYEELELNSLLEQSVVLNQSYADQFGMQLKLIKTDKDIYIKADKSRMLQVISNLISNAVKFSKLGEEVCIMSETNDNNVKVSIIDHGIGIPEEAKYKIFQSFSQVDSSDTRAKGGTGLGLSISKLIVENMGGNIGFESKINQGSTFYFNMQSITKGTFITDNQDTVKELATDDF